METIGRPGLFGVKFPGRFLELRVEVWSLGSRVEIIYSIGFGIEVRSSVLKVWGWGVRSDSASLVWTPVTVLSSGADACNPDSKPSTLNPKP